jgi:hypothetical protein
MNIDDKIIAKLRSMKDMHLSATEMLVALIQEIDRRGVEYTPLNLACVAAFKEAFGLELGEASSIMAWHGFQSKTFGSSITDADLDRFVGSAIYGKS